MDNKSKSPTSVRIDKFLWAVRAFGSRVEATEACKAGHVKIAAAAVKPAREVRVGEVLEVKTRGMTRTFLVLVLLENRVGAKLVSNYVEDRTPAEEILRALERAKAVERPKGAGRPTKRERRVLDDLWGSENAP